MVPKQQILLVALGGNALVRKGQTGTIDEQFTNLAVPMAQLAKLSRRFKLIITHGNGPQVGNLLLQQEACRDVPRLPLEILVAQTQGQIGYMIESVLDAKLMEMGIRTAQKFVSLISYVVVDPNDPAFTAPSKPIGPAFTKAEADALPYPTRKTAKGYRRVVVSPKPVTIVEKREIKRLIEMDFIVICCGGGGIPVVRDGRGFSGVDAVIDKDLASAKLAQEVGADRFVIATDVPGAALGYGTDRQQYLDEVAFADAEKYLDAGQFPPGSMGPKLQACMAAVAAGAKQAVITHLADIESAVAGKAGTQVIP
jgi:carbamate kinase